MLGEIGTAKMGPNWTKLRLSWLILAPIWGQVGPCWAKLALVGAMLGPGWGKLEPSWTKFSYLGCNLGPSCAKLVPSFSEVGVVLSQVEPSWGQGKGKVNASAKLSQVHGELGRSISQDTQVGLGWG